MNRDVVWLNKYQQVLAFVETHQRGPSRHHIEEHDMLNWMKFNRKKDNLGKLVGFRKEKFDALRKLISSFNRVNQYK